MILNEVVERFEKSSPFAVMVRASLENVFAEERINRLFERHARRQRQKELLFSTVADIMGLVACKIRPSVHAAYQARMDEVGVTVKALYDKLQRVEPDVSRQLVRETADHLATIIDTTKGLLPRILPGYTVRIVDGSHWQASERRLGPLRVLNAAPLPGQALVVLDPQRRLVRDLVPCEDAHAQERSLFGSLLDRVEQGEVWIADRNFSTALLLFGMARRNAYFLIRQHANSPRLELVGKRKKKANADNGVAYEQRAWAVNAEGERLAVRRITIELYEPTREGETEIHLLTNVPARTAALRLAEAYRQRWTIEKAFHDLALHLHGEVVTLGYPQAALFAFCMSLVAFNIYSLLLAAMRAAHGVRETEQQLSFFYMADEIGHTYRGLEIALPATYWQRQYAALSAAQLARAPIRLATNVEMARYRKHPRGPKKKPLNFNKRNRGHVSTARVLQNQSKR